MAMKLIKHQNDYYLVKKEYHNGLQKSVIILSGREVIASTQNLEHLPLIKKTQIEDLLLRKVNILARAESDKGEGMKLDYQDGLYYGFIKGYECSEKNNTNSDKLNKLITFVKSVRDDWENVSEDIQIKAENLIFYITKEPEEWDVTIQLSCSYSLEYPNHKMGCECKDNSALTPVIKDKFINIISIQ